MRSVSIKHYNIVLGVVFIASTINISEITNQMLTEMRLGYSTKPRGDVKLAVRATHRLIVYIFCFSGWSNGLCVYAWHKNGQSNVTSASLTFT
jgi:hypothetical protein